MMGTHQPQKDLFSYQVDLDRRIRSDHPLRRIADLVDFNFVREKVKDKYGYNGNVSVDPVIIIKLMFLLFFENVRSERELMQTIPERLDWLWFLGYGLDDEVPDHSVLSKARKRWGPEVFEAFFVRIVGQCAQLGLVDGKKIHVDGSLVDANASKGSVVKGPPELIAALKQAYGVEEQKLSDTRSPYYQPVNRRVMSKTDPDSAVVRQKRSYDSRPRYKHHRVVDDTYGVITAVETTPGDVEENERLMELVDQHEANTESRTETVVADRQYGTNANFRKCHERGIRSHMGDFKSSLEGKGRSKGIFPESAFIYDPVTDRYRCPAGEELHRRKHKKARGLYEYAAARHICAACALRAQCTRAKNGTPRTIVRHFGQEAINAARVESHSEEAYKDRARRKWLIEGSFGDATTRHGFKRSRWRRLWRQQIQDYLIATIQNVRIALRHAAPTPTGVISQGKNVILALYDACTASIRRYVMPIQA